MIPPTCGSMATVCMGSTVPFACSTYGTVRTSALATVTGTACAGGAACFEQARSIGAAAARRQSERRSIIAVVPLELCPE